MAINRHRLRCFRHEARLGNWKSQGALALRDYDAFMFSCGEPPVLYDLHIIPMPSSYLTGTWYLLLLREQNIRPQPTLYGNACHRNNSTTSTSSTINSMARLLAPGPLQPAALQHLRERRRAWQPFVLTSGYIVGYVFY